MVSCLEPDLLPFEEHGSSSVQVILQKLGAARIYFILFTIVAVVS